MQRLQSRAQFQAALAGATVARTAHFALHRCALPWPTDDAKALFVPIDDAWLGAMVPKRWARRAVTRNTIKRQIYSVSTQSEFVWPVAAHVVRLRTAFDRKQFVSATSDALKAAVRTELFSLFDKATRA
jgi:ribonuclease P protein component